MTDRRDPVTLLAAAVALLLVVACLSAPLVGDALAVDVTETDILRRFEPPSWNHPLGTDDLGRDLLVRLLYGGRVSVLVGLAAAVMAACVGSVLGVVAGYVGGRFDAVLMRLTDGIIALPLLAILIVLTSIDPTKLGLSREAMGSPVANMATIVVVTALFSWTTVARLVRASTLSLKTRDFVRAAVAMGAPPWRIMLRHILPNAVSPIIVATALAVAEVIKFESVLSFLGLGIKPPTPSWGNMLTNAQEMIWDAPQLAIWPGVLILVAVASCNLLADALARWLDPRRHRRR